MKPLLPVASALIIAIAGAAPPARASFSIDNTLADAQGLYAQASYDQALSVLDRLDPTQTTTLEEGQAIRRYRALCLLALGRSADAEGALESLVRADPASAATDDMPPRLQTMLQEVRGRVVRELVRQGYERGRDLYGREQFGAATIELTRVIALLDDPTLGLTNEPALADVRLLADGFVRLATAARPAVPAATGTAGIMPPKGPAVQNEPTPRAAAGFIPPEPIVQDFPPFPRSARPTRNEGELEVHVGADGRVTSARVTVAIHPIYDVMLVAAAKNWKYQPARRYGEPVPFTKRVQVLLQVTR
jgi:TonB family protein